MNTLVAFFFLLSISGCFTAKIIMMPMFGHSHYLVLAKLADELGRRGHEVTIFIGEQAVYAKGKPYVKFFNTDKIKKSLRDIDQGMLSNKSPIAMIMALYRAQKIYCDAFLSSTDVLNELKTDELLVGDGLYPCSNLAAAKFDIPHVVVFGSALGTPTMQLYGVSTYPSYVPLMLSWLPANMGFIDRIKNFGHYLLRFYFVEGIAYPPYRELKEKHNIRPHESIRETMRTVDLLLMGRDFVLDYAMPLPPFVREVGSFMSGPAKPLPADLESFMESSGGEGVILVSFGSMVDTFDNKVVEVMNEAFSKVPQKVIWRINTDNFDGKIASNIKIMRWLPQNDILGHKKTKLFITHAGAGGVAESAFHGVPMICSPFFADQFDNAANVLSIGLGETLSVKTATVEQLVGMMNQVIQEERYKRNGIRVSNVIRMRPRTPLQEAAELIEYLLAVGHLAHLKPKGLELPFYQLYMLDVVLVLGLVVVLVLVIIVVVVKQVINICGGTSKKTKMS